jgi:hypothetical protein|tara:strand:- start:114 stop:872 length:759 start_codon:yes stop_codon:yes gene_type:complete
MEQFDVWAIIDKQASDLADHLLHSQPEEQVDAIDREKQYHDVINQLGSGEIDPKKDWEVIIRPVLRKEKIQEQIDKHFDIALRQAVYTCVKYQFYMDKIKKNVVRTRQDVMLFEQGMDMIKAFACAHQHATAWRLLISVRDNSYEIRTAKAAQAKEEKKDEKDILLRSLIKGALTKHRPSGGWKSYKLAAPEIAKALFPLIAQYSLPLSENIDQLSDKIEKLIFKEPRLRKIYDENAKEPLTETVKVRKVRL